MRPLARYQYTNQPLKLSNFLSEYFFLLLIYKTQNNLTHVDDCLLLLVIIINKCKIIFHSNVTSILNDELLFGIIPKFSVSRNLIRLLLLLLLKKVGSARMRESDVRPISPNTSAPQYQPIGRKKRKGKGVEDYSRDRAA